MSDQFDEVVHNARQPSTWLRILFMLVFCVILYVVGVIFFVLTVAQALFALLTGADNDNLRRLGQALTVYVTQILSFISFNTEERPFPFMPFPEVEPAADDDNGRDSSDGPDAGETVTESPAEAPAPTAARKAPRKAAPRKKTARPAGDDNAGN